MAGRLSDFSDGGRFEPRPPLWVHFVEGFVKGAANELVRRAAFPPPPPPALPLPLLPPPPPLALRVVRTSPKPPPKAIRVVRQRQNPDPGLERRLTRLEATEQRQDRQIGEIARQGAATYAELTLVRQIVLGDEPDSGGN